LLTERDVQKGQPLLEAGFERTACMTVTFAPELRKMRQIARSCRMAGISYELDLVPSPSITCQFDNAAEFIAWHALFADAFGWSPYDCDVSLSA
jgi:hypothetical protein